MQNALWLSFALPSWYFSTLLALFNPGTAIISAVVWIGTLCLVAAVVLGIRRRLPVLFWFGLSPLMSQILVAVAGLYRGQVPDPQATWILLGFLTLQGVFLSGLLMGIVFTQVRARQSPEAPVSPTNRPAPAGGALLPAALLDIFCITYALFAAFIAGMAFQDVWL